MKKVLLYLVLLVAITMAGVVAYVSVTGLLKIFTGAGTIGLILFMVIELAKIIATMAVHTYSKTIGVLYTGLTTIFIGIAMVITSMGIYGFLSSSYKESFAEMNTINSKIEVLNNRKDNIKQRLEVAKNENSTVSSTISELNKGLANNTIQYKDRETGKIITTTSSNTRKTLEEQLKKANKRLDKVNNETDSLTNKLFDIENEVLEMSQSNEASVELSSLQYLSDVTGQDMDNVMKWFIILLLIIGDPMAVIMVIIFSRVINKNGDTGKKYEKKKINKPTPPNKPINTPLKTTNEEPKPKNIPTTKSTKDENKSNNSSTIKNTKEVEKKPKIKKNKLKDKIRREDIKEIKEKKTRGYSVEVPKPKKEGGVKKVGANKEVRGGKPNRLFFNKLNR